MYHWSRIKLKLLFDMHLGPSKVLRFSFQKGLFKNKKNSDNKKLKTINF